MTKDHTHLFEANSKKYAFDSERLVAVSLDDITYDLLTDLKTDKLIAVNIVNMKKLSLRKAIVPCKRL